MKREIITTGDGSKTIHIPEWNEQYHSKHGAVQEARHVFLETGLQNYIDRPSYNTTRTINILEMGFGTGLNALLTFFKAKDKGVSITYTGVEAFPITKNEVTAMDYAALLDHPDAHSVYQALHSCPWEISNPISEIFLFTKREQTFKNISDSACFDLVYFDAFGPRVQPELWTEAIFLKMYQALREGGVLTTYCAQGAARRAMQAVGFTVERLPGPPGKREMLRATKI